MEVRSNTCACRFSDETPKPTTLLLLLASGPSDGDKNQCPKKGAVADGVCHPGVFSFKDGKCVAPEYAQCMHIETGAWGCVPFPGATKDGRWIARILDQRQC